MPETTPKHCTKRPHANRYQAWKHIRTLQARGLDTKPGLLRPYWCIHCLRYHIGHFRQELKEAPRG